MLSLNVNVTVIVSIKKLNKLVKIDDSCYLHFFLVFLCSRLNICWLFITPSGITTLDIPPLGRRNNLRTHILCSIFTTLQIDRSNHPEMKLEASPKSNDPCRKSILLRAFRRQKSLFLSCSPCKRVKRGTSEIYPFNEVKDTDHFLKLGDFKTQLIF